MSFSILEALGGLGLFLFGMTTVTGALKSLGDTKMRLLMVRFVNNPVKGAITGAVSTAILQSSSATTVAAVGFVGAGLLTFPESLGIIFGANLGTTLTGWIVALIGIKLELGTALLPMILLGAILRLTRRTYLEQLGLAFAGFGLIFVGIDVLQDGLSGLQGNLTPEQFPSDTFLGRLLLVLIGVVVTIVTQSSSAGVATALAAVHANAISLNQAAAMVIGMDVGTTATAALATIGGNVQARRTGFAHVIYNTFTGIGALVLLTPFMQIVESIFPGVQATDPEYVLVGFHSFFNALGVLLVLPFTKHFANLIIRLFPDRGNPLTRQLDKSLLENPVIAINAVGNTIQNVMRELLGELTRHLQDVKTKVNGQLLDDVADAVNQCKGYMQELTSRALQPNQIHNYLSLMHVLDHLERIELRVWEKKRLKKCRADEAMAEMSDKLCIAATTLAKTSSSISPADVDQLRSINRNLKIAVREYRHSCFEDMSNNKLSASTASQHMKTARTLRRIGYHVWRISHHLSLTIETIQSEQTHSTGSA